MNKNLAIGLGVAAVIVIAAAGVAMYNGATDPGYPSSATSTEQNPNPGPELGAVANRQPGAPVVTTDDAAVPSNSTAVVTGKVMPNGAQTTYWYEYGKTTDLGNRTSAQGLGSGFTPINAPGYITGLSANTAYYYRLSAKNSYGMVHGTTYKFSTNSNPPPAGKAPVVHTEAADSLERTTAIVKGSVNPGGAQTSYWFEYGPTSEMGDTTALQSAGNGSAAVAASASLSDLKPLTKYYYRINAQNQYGTVNSVVGTFTTKGPADASGPAAATAAASDIAKDAATLNGKVDPNGEETTYWFEYSADSLLGTLLGSTTRTQVAGSENPSAVSAGISGLSANTKYFYRLVAQNSRGIARGDIVPFTTSP